MNIINMLRSAAGLCVVSVFLGVISPAQALAYTYVSHEYGYSIECPEKPLGVVPLIDSMQKGEILVFKNDGYNILKGWVVAANAFDSNQVPDFDNMSDENAQKYATALIANRGYETVLFIPLHGRKVLYAVCPPDVYVDADKTEDDKSPKKTISQRIETYIPGQKSNYVIAFFETGEITQQDMSDYQNGLLSFKEVADEKQSTDSGKK